MSHEANYRMTVAGFLVLYASVMGSLLVWSVPLFQEYRFPALIYVTAPLAVVGICLTVVAHAIRIRA